jgi:hypothetical protein
VGRILEELILEKRIMLVRMEALSFYKGGEVGNGLD